MNLKLVDIKTFEASGSDVAVNQSIFEKAFNETLIWQVITTYQARGRSWSKQNLNRAAVSGGGKKPWRQKGTGNARHGSTRSPIWTGGGVTFRALPIKPNIKLNKKMYRGAMASILAEQNRRSALKVVADLPQDIHKTKDAEAWLAALKGQRVLIITQGVNEALVAATRNLVWVNVLEATHVDPVSLYGADVVIASQDALKTLEGRFSC